MSENNLFIYEYKKELKDRSTLAFPYKLNNKEIKENYKFIDMELKKVRNPNAQALRD